MIKNCTNEKTAARQKWIEDGLLELMMEKSFEKITVTDLCRHLALSRRSFYRYFSSIEDVLAGLMDHTFQDMAFPNATLNMAELQIIYEFWLHHKTLLSALVNSGMHGKIAEYSLKYANVEILKKHLSIHDLGMDVSQEVNLFVISGLSSLLLSWHAEGFQKTPEQMALIAYRLLSALNLSEQ